MTDDSIEQSTEKPNHGKRGRGNLWVPSNEQRRQVKYMAAIGTPQEHIAKLVGVSEPTLRRACREELSIGSIEANVKVSSSLFQQATHPTRPSIAAAIWWEKTRQGRSERVDAATGETPAKKEQRRAKAREVASGGKLKPGSAPKLTVVK